MSILDLRRIGPLKVATIDDQATVTIHARTGLALPLAPGESCLFQAFLRTNELRRVAACGGTRLSERILVWKPEEAKMAIDEIFCRLLWPLIERRPGRASICGKISVGQQTDFYYGGFAPDRSAFVLVPDSLREMRYRELLIALCQRELCEQANDIHTLAAFVQDEEDADDPAGERCSPLAEAAREEAVHVPYWLQLAGSTPNAWDERDARRATAEP